MPCAVTPHACIDHRLVSGGCLQKTPVMFYSIRPLLPQYSCHSWLSIEAVMFYSIGPLSPWYSCHRWLIIEAVTFYSIGPLSPWYSCHCWLSVEPVVVFTASDSCCPDIAVTVDWALKWSCFTSDPCHPDIAVTVDCHVELVIFFYSIRPLSSWYCHPGRLSIEPGSFFYIIRTLSPWYSCHSWLGIKNQLTAYPTRGLDITVTVDWVFIGPMYANLVHIMTHNMLTAVWARVIQTT